MWDCHRSTNNRYSGDNRLIALESSYRQRGLAPRCRLILSWGCIRSQGSGCSPVKRVRELGSERRETVRSLSDVGVRIFEEEFSTVREDLEKRTSGVTVVLPRANAV